MATEKLIGREEMKELYNPHTDVFKATHKMNSSATKWLRESYMERSFISFTYGGKKIEDFNLIAVIEGSRIQRQAYSSFEDSTTDYEMVDGHMYWGTHYTGNKLDLVLATDGIAENLLEDFKYWFQAGVIRELILAEHPNRAIMARMAGAPMMSVLPFKESTTVMIEGKEYETFTTLYKGTIAISFTMEEPFWYSKVNLLGKFADENKGMWSDIWTNANGDSVNFYTDQDALKIIKEDGIPIISMIRAPICLGNDLYVDLDYTTLTENDSSEILIQTLANPILDINEIPAAGLSSNDLGEDVGFIGPRVFNRTEDQPKFVCTKNDRLYLYYPGSAPSYPIINFTLTPLFANSYISSPRNSYLYDENPYNTITCKSANTTELKFTLPSIFASFNEVIKIFKTVSDPTNYVAIREAIRENVHHKAVRAWAILVVDYYSSNSVNFNNDGYAYNYMRYFLKDVDENNTSFPASFSIDCKTGKAIGKFKYRKINEEQIGNLYDNNIIDTTFSNFGTITENPVEENVGDMICSNYIKLDSRNYPTDDGYIMAYDDRSDINKNYGYVSKSKNGYYVKHNCNADFINFSFTYQYMYY